MIGFLKDRYIEAVLTALPFTTPNKHQKYLDDISHTQESSKGIISRILRGDLRFWESNNRNREIPNTEKEEVLQALKDVQTSIDTALRKNTLNIRTDIFDLLPVFIAKSGNPYLIAAGILGILISIYGSVNEFYYRMRVLNPKIQDAHKIYNRYMSENTNEQGINRYMDIATDTVETVIEGISFFLPQLILASNLLNFLVEIPIDVGSREKYYEEGRKIADMIKTIKKSDT